MKQRIAHAAVAALAAGVLALAATGAARAEGGDNIVVAVNTKDGSFVYRVRLVVRRVRGDSVDEANAAVAVASCTDCQTVAIAIQVLLVFSDANVVTPENLALAMNVECSFCRTLATAYQSMLMTAGAVHFTADGNRRLAEIRRDLQQLRHAGLTIWEIQAQVDALAGRLHELLLTELVPAGNADRP